jgi:hypothetical protein
VRKGNAACKARRRAVAKQRPQARPQSVGANQDCSAVLRLGPSCAAVIDGSVHADGVDGEIVDLCADRQRDVRLVSDRLDQRLLQVGAVDHPIGRAVTLKRRGIERHCHDFAAGGAGSQPDGRGLDYCGLKAFGEPQCDKNPRGVGRKLNAGANLLQFFRLVEQRDLDALPGERQGRRQSTDAGAGDQYAVRGHVGSAARGLRPFPSREARIPADALRWARGPGRTGIRSSNSHI